MITAKIAGVTYETDDAKLLDTARHCGPGFARKIAAREGKVFRIAK
jgi:hypothetical protein